MYELASTAGSGRVPAIHAVNLMIRPSGGLLSLLTYTQLATNYLCTVINRYEITLVFRNQVNYVVRSVVRIR